ncbi:protein neuralized [Caerostris darwini]|uniref:Protein neuralized n=1 Tax=Caerostris darwini TaxID=1538125 RepID=A0AAV4RKK5_9ARAC|nr:protein neuralized [Caerostris darwini]
MGAEGSSNQKHRTASSCDDKMTARVKNNYDPLRFHQIHGDNVKLLKRASAACRYEGFCKGIAFSNRPVMVGELVCIKFLEISTNWSGALRIGFTANDPMSMKSKLPRYACPDLTNMPGYWAKAIAERMAKKDSILYYYVDQNGDVHYGIDLDEHGVFFGGVNTSCRLWAVLDIYGNTVAVEFVDPNSLNPECINDSSRNNENVSLINEAGQQSSPLKDEINQVLSFHSIHGRNVSLRTHGTTALRKHDCNIHAYVFTQCPLRLLERVFIKIGRINPKCYGNLFYGITSCDPQTLNHHVLPENTDDLLDRPEYWIVRTDANIYEVGDVIAYSINNDGEVTVMKNGEYNTAIFHVDPTQPLWLFFNMIGPISEINLLGSYFNDNYNRLESMKVALPPKSEKSGGVPGASGQQTLNECVICFGEQIDCAIYRCGHMLAYPESTFLCTKRDHGGATAGMLNSDKSDDLT